KDEKPLDVPDVSSGGRFRQTDADRGKNRSAIFRQVITPLAKKLSDARPCRRCVANDCFARFDIQTTALWHRFCRLCRRGNCGYRRGGVGHAVLSFAAFQKREIALAAACVDSWADLRPLRYVVASDYSDDAS